MEDSLIHPVIWLMQEKFLTELWSVMEFLWIHEEHQWAEQDGLDLVCEEWGFTQWDVKVVY